MVNNNRLVVMLMSFFCDKGLLLSHFFLSVLLALVLSACSDVLNSPYSDQEKGLSILYMAFAEPPKYLDPVQSYSEDEARLLYQIYEPPLQFHYLKRPYALIPATAMSMPSVVYRDRAGHILAEPVEPEQVAQSVWTIHLRPGTYYQPHPAFSRDLAGHARYLSLTPEQIQNRRTPADFPHDKTATRELVADDYVYQMKRLAHPRLRSPIFELMKQYIPGLAVLKQSLPKSLGQSKVWIDWRQYALPGIEVVDRYTYRITLEGKYPQFPYWLSMPFFAPMPWEADAFYAQPGMYEAQLTLDFWPVGTGPYMLSEYQPNARIVLSKNPNWRGERYPTEGEPEDLSAGLLADAGRVLPFLDHIIFTREKEAAPYWNKFLQGYYDVASVSSENFDQAVRLSSTGGLALTDDMRMRDIRFVESVAPTINYMGLNALDPVMGGTSDRARKLRQAISIVLDQEEFISIFLGGRGVAAHNILPPDIFGYQPGRRGMNEVMYRWVEDAHGGHAERLSVDVARQLLAEAGYPGGRDQKTGEPLVLYLDTTDSEGGLGGKARVDWLNKKFALLGIQLIVRGTDYNRFQDKVNKGATQMFFWGWNADYPDPENFLFLLTGSQSKVRFQGENAANYRHPDIDRLFSQMKVLDNTPQRQLLISQMLKILEKDAPWVWGFHDKTYTLRHGWLTNAKSGKIIRNVFKYYRVNTTLREHRRHIWNRPMWWPLLGLLLGAGVLVGAVYVQWLRRERRTAWGDYTPS